MTFKNICAKKVFKTKEGEERVKWLNVGTLKETEEGKQFIELNILPNVPLYVFERKEKDEGSVEL